jgi:hypothetical protein
MLGPTQLLGILLHGQVGAAVGMLVDLVQPCIDRGVKTYFRRVALLFPGVSAVTSGHDGCCIGSGTTTELVSACMEALGVGIDQAGSVDTLDNVDPRAEKEAFLREQCRQRLWCGLGSVSAKVDVEHELAMFSDRTPPLWDQSPHTPEQGRQFIFVDGHSLFLKAVGEAISVEA